MSTATAAAGFREARRELGLTGDVEKRLLLWLAARVPRAVGSDHLTALGFAGTVAAAVLYAGSAQRRWTLVAVIGALAVNWLGDSLDGTLARYRRQTRPRYGFYVDHLLDSVGAAVLIGGMAAGGLLRPAVAAALIVVYLLMSIEVFLATYTLARFKIAYGGIGGTELRLVLAAAGLATLVWSGPVTAGLSLFDLLGVIAAGGVLVSLVLSAWRNGGELYRAETVRRTPQND